MQNGIYRGRWLSSGALVLLQLSGCNTKKRQMVVSPPFCWSEPPYRCNDHLQRQMPAPYPTPSCAIYAFPWPRVSCSGCPTQHLLCKPMQRTTSSVACLGCLMHCAGVDTTRRHHRSPLTTQSHNSHSSTWPPTTPNYEYCTFLCLNGNAMDALARATNRRAGQQAT